LNLRIASPGGNCAQDFFILADSPNAGLKSSACSPIEKGLDVTSHRLKPSVRVWAALALLGAVCQASGQVRVVAAAKSPLEPLTAEQAGALFLGKTDKVGSNSVQLYDQADSNPIREVFYTKVADKTQPQVRAAWSRLVFSGKAVAPKEAANSAELKKALAANPLAVGYMEPGAVDASVKVLLSVD
jgi:ABC-type phosphate transport system substrate-binding protein